MTKKRFLITLLSLVTLVSVSVTVFLLIKSQKADEVNNPDVYPPVPRDSAAERADESGSQPALSNPEGGGAVSLSYSTELSASTGDGTADIFFMNPARSNQGVVLQLHITDKELVEKLGKTGRTDPEKTEIENNADYNSETSRVIIAESGLIEPGFKLLKLKLGALPDGTVLPAGNYNAVYYLLAYDNETNERAIVNMQIPVVLTVAG